jgi:TusA-related sulfurtransferase
LNDTPHYLDLTGMHCPQPAIRCKAALARLGRGGLLYADVTDRGSVAVIPRLVAALGDELVEVQSAGCVCRFIIRRNRPQRRRRMFSLRERVAAWLPGQPTRGAIRQTLQARPGP